jgi:hypothetical protein
MENTNKQSASIRMLYLEKLLNEACELLIIFEDGNIKYNEELESEMSVSADDEAQDWSVFGDNKI